ncbi:MAG TPA: type III secretion system translocon subunit SctE [Labilithrix sp.]|nr:type III secretion system translocon subunit SctE [Labilithrix sp.]
MNGVSIQASPNVVRALPGAPAGATGPAGAPASLLPAASSTLDIGGALVEIMKLSSALSEAQTKGSMASAESAAAARKEATEKRMQAINDAIEAARKAQEARSSGGLFDFVTDNLGPAGLVGLVTGTAYIVAADAVAHAVGLEDTKLDLADAAGVGVMMTGPVGLLAYSAQLLIKRLGPEELQQALEQAPTISDKDTRLANKLALTVIEAQLAIAATIASGGTAAPAVVAIVGIGISTTTQLLQESGVLEKVFKSDAKWVALGGCIAGAALTIGGAIAAGPELLKKMKNIAQVATTIKSGLEAAHDIGQGVSNLRAAGFQHDADNAHIEATKQKQVLEMVERLVENIIDDMKSLKESAQKTSELMQGAMQTNNQTMLLAGTMKA